MEGIQLGELYSPCTIEEVVKLMGFSIREDYRGKDLLLVGVLKGSFVFMADLVRQIYARDPKMGFIEVKSYSGTKSLGSTTIALKLTTDVAIEGKDVLIVEDIVETGTTLIDVHKCIARQNPASIEVCSLLLKDVKRKKACPEVKYSGFPVPADTFVVGYGLDLDGSYRALPYIGKLPENKDASKETK